MVNTEFALNPVTGKELNAWVLNWIYPKMLITAYINLTFFSFAKTAQLFTLPSAPATFSAVHPRASHLSGLRQRYN